MGNLILTDDGVGIKVAQKIKEMNPDLEVIETTEAGIALLDYIVDYDKLIIIDSIKTEQGEPGELYKFELEDLKPDLGLSSSHGVDIATAIKFGEELRYRMPQSVSIYAIEVKDNTTFAEDCTKEVEERILFITKQIIDEENLERN